jgi:murein DD-endopeptidase MepM/ murein hydrolase activator NlpD
MRFLRVVKRVGLTFIFIFGILFALWLAFFAWPEVDIIGHAEASVPGARIEPATSTSVTVTPARSAASTTPAASTSAAPAATPNGSTAAPAATFNMKAFPHLIIPVSGIRPEQLYDSFGDARSEGRSHRALDIPAAKGTPVLAATSGVIKRIFYSEKGGKTLYQLSDDGKVVYYYAHLDCYASDLNEGRPVKQGEVIAYVGDTGNAGSGNYHLHFAMWTVENPKRIWEGSNINPFSLLR